MVYVRVREAAQKQAARAELAHPADGAGLRSLVLENKTGRLLAMAGAFSYPDSQLNRAVQSVRQPGSTLKPLTYLTALQKGLQPNTLVMDEPLTLPPIGGNTALCAHEGLLVAEECRWRRRRRHHAAARAGGFAQSRDRAADGQRHREQRPKQGSTGSANLRSRRSSTSNAAAFIRSSSARSRCG